MRPELNLCSAIIGHLVGDYLLQNDWMALNKKKSSLPCFIHCLIWSSSIVLFGGFGRVFSVPWAILFATHFIQDRTNIVRFWMTRINRQPKFVEPPTAPWSLIVVDNVWHILTIWAVWIFLTWKGGGVH